MFSKEVLLFLYVSLWPQALGEEDFVTLELSLRISPGHCEEHETDLTSALVSLAKILSDSSHSAFLPKSCLEIKNSSPDSPSGYYTLLNTTSGATSITYCDMDNLLFCASSLTSVLQQLQVADIKGQTGDTGMTGPPGPNTAGAVYTRWGSSLCPNVSGTQTVYQGRAGKTYFNQGGGTNYQCMPDDPEYSDYEPGVQGNNHIYGVEYEQPIRSEAWNGNVPCAVCYALSRGTVMMIPAKLSCPNHWTLEYVGYLMTQYNDEKGATFECVDASQEIVPNTLNNTDGGTFYHVEAICNEGLPCPAYNEEKELTCVVCTR